MANTINLNLRSLPRDVYLSIIEKQVEMKLKGTIFKPNLANVVAQIVREWKQNKEDGRSE